MCSWPCPSRAAAGTNGWILVETSPGVVLPEFATTASMEQGAPGRDQPGVDDVADPLVHEPEPLVGDLHHPAADQLLEPFGRGGLGEPGCGLEQREVGFPADDRGDCGQVASPLTQAP